MSDGDSPPSVIKVTESLYPLLVGNAETGDEPRIFAFATGAEVGDTVDCELASTVNVEDDVIGANDLTIDGEVHTYLILYRHCKKPMP